MLPHCLALLFCFTADSGQIYDDDDDDDGMQVYNYDNVSDTKLSHTMSIT